MEEPTVQCTKVYDSLCAKSGEILENILEWEGSFDEFSNETTENLPIFPSSNLDTIEKELIRSAKSHNVVNKHRYIIKLLKLNDMAGIQDSQSYSPEYTITLETTSSDIAGIQDSQSYSPECTITLETTLSDIAGIQDFLQSRVLD